MIATITNRAGDIVFNAVCSVREGEFSDAEKAEFARLMGEVDTLIMGVVRRRELCGKPPSLELAEPTPVPVELLW